MNSEDRESKCGEGQVAERRYIEMVINRGQRKAWQIIINVDSRTRTHTHTHHKFQQTKLYTFVQRVAELLLSAHRPTSSAASVDALFIIIFNITSKGDRRRRREKESDE